MFKEASDQVDRSTRGARMMKSLFVGFLSLIAIGWCVAEPYSHWARLASIVLSIATIVTVLTVTRGQVRLLAATVIFVALVFAWIFRYEDYHGVDHRNRITGAWCAAASSCW